MLQPINKNDYQVLSSYLKSRSQEISSDVLVTVSNILKDVRQQGDIACQKYTKQFDGIEMDAWKVSEQELEEAISHCDSFFMESMKKAKKNITYFHQAQVNQSYILQEEKGVYLGQRVLPLSSVGIYVPGGRAQYPSSVLMNAIPAAVAGVKRIVMVTPPNKEGKINPNIAFAAKLAGVTDIYKIGGAQAIAALAYGTETIPSVDKICGPGNIFVAAAKKLVYGKVDIDMIAGPSEILVVADDHANPAFVAADLLSQAEHDPMASPILLATSQTQIDAINAELKEQSAQLPKKEIVEQSLKNYGKSILCDTISECIDIANEIAPEHLELMVEDPMSYLAQVVNAGSVFMGYYTCESIGDYFGGTNHVLPTNGTARFSSALGVDSFVKRSCFLHYSKEALDAYGQYIIQMAEEENLDGHANAVKVRVQSWEKK
ncbi:histidinol dehydrogenase [Absicoccus intestinalis]|uniref:Histidinol dehydrogenase n=1 Tax=Absicoccus intestinalis TaxID=2926319 RepID=A0ABU4WKT1_9FIRM|nr:histidinol dehydrogenase [Absicoccus sp. CLA-KB-P134]MDX8417169.1 histidinol dehydrogenase [Absicoccus sp. CLA-KB-P134]